MSRAFPHNLEAENAVLSALLMRPAKFYEVADIVAPDDFYSEFNARLFRGIGEVVEESKACDVVMLQAHMNLSSDDLNRIIAMADSTATSFLIDHYARVVKDYSIRRRVIARMMNATEEMRKPQVKTDVALSDLQEDLFQIQKEGDSRRHETRWFDGNGILDESLQYAEELAEKKKTNSIYTGFREVDRLVDMGIGTLSVIAARPSMGKSALALNIAENAARRGHRVLFFVLEMSARSMGLRSLIGSSGFSRQDLIEGKADWEAVKASRSNLSSLPLGINEHAAPTLGFIRRKAMEARSKRGAVDLIIVDYLQLMEPPAGIQNRQEQIAAMSRGLKIIAKDLQTRVLALSQLNRKIEDKPIYNRRPNLSDIRESGAIEQDADIVMGLWREEQYHRQEGQEPPHDCTSPELLILKQREGATGKINLFFDAARVRFSDPITEVRAGYQGEP